LSLSVITGVIKANIPARIAFQVASRTAFREAYRRAAPLILEPLMKISVEGPGEFQGAVFRSLMARRGMIIGSMEDEASPGSTRKRLWPRCSATPPTLLRDPGKAEFTMEFLKHGRVPPHIAELLTEQHLEKQRAAQK
jgi:elongation factor G